MKLFFTTIANDSSLQERLYFTDKLSDVASIANQLGFNVKDAVVLKAQAGRVLMLLAENARTRVIWYPVLSLK